MNNMADAKYLNFESVGECYICTSHKYDKSGYMPYNAGENRGYLHDMLYEEIHGDVPGNCHVHHLCENTWCLNPAHMVSLRDSDLEVKV